MRYMLSSIKQWLKLCRFRHKWRKKNKHNETYPNNVFPENRVKIGKNTYGVLNVYSYRNTNESLIIGCFCSIASDVLFVLSGEHVLNYITTYPIGEKIYRDGSTAVTKGPIVIEDDVWIGVRCTILSGVRIGQGSVIAANSIVFKDVPPYSIYIGTRVVKQRFSDSIVKKALKIDFQSITDEHLSLYKQYSKTEIDEDTIDKVLQVLPHKLEEK